MELLLPILLAFLHLHFYAQPEVTLQCTDVGFGTVTCNGSVR